jgi:hypothetical protein
MKPFARVAFTALVVALLLSFGSTAAPAQGRHPAYLRALSDLRAARALLDRHDGGELRHEEKEAIHAINDAISDIKKASIDDGKDLNWHPPVDTRLDYPGRLRQAREFLESARRDVSQEEDNSFAQGLQQRAFGHIDKALHETNECIRIVAAR